MYHGAIDRRLNSDKSHSYQDTHSLRLGLTGASSPLYTSLLSLRICNLSKLQYWRTIVVNREGGMGKEMLAEGEKLP